MFSLYNQQLAHQANVFSQIQNQALGGGAGYAGAGGFGGGAAYGGAGAGGFGGSVGSFGSTGGNGQAYGGTYGGGYPSYNQGGGGGGGSGANYASSGGAVGYGGQQQLQASIYPSNQVRFKIINALCNFSYNHKLSVLTKLGLSFWR